MSDLENAVHKFSVEQNKRAEYEEQLQELYASNPRNALSVEDMLTSPVVHRNKPVKPLSRSAFSSISASKAKHEISRLRSPAAGDV